MNDQLTEKLKANLFPASWAAIRDWNKYPWHGTRKGPDTFVPHSSQALSIDVFGTLKVSTSRHQIFAELARKLGLPDSGPWEVELEWVPDKEPYSNPLKERRLTQVDAIAESQHAYILFECKFTEQDGGPCSQPQPLQKGPNRGMKQCDGNYQHQINPVSDIASRCTLTGKGIRYWKFVPDVFVYDPDSDYCPCPFKGSWFQWMRNLTLAAALSRESGKKAAFCIVYVDSPGLLMPQMLRSKEWDTFRGTLRGNAVCPTTLSYQQVLQIAREADSGNHMWTELEQWVSQKVQLVEERRK